MTTTTDTAPKCPHDGEPFDPTRCPQCVGRCPSCAFYPEAFWGSWRDVPQACADCGRVLSGVAADERRPGAESLVEKAFADGFVAGAHHAGRWVDVETVRAATAGYSAEERRRNGPAIPPYSPF